MRLMGKLFTVMGCCNLKRIYNAPSELELGGTSTCGVEEVSFAEGLTYVGGISTIELTKWDEEGVPRADIWENIKTLKKVTLPSTLKEIGCETFKDNKNLTTINLPDGLTRIGSYALQGLYRPYRIYFSSGKCKRRYRRSCIYGLQEPSS